MTSWMLDVNANISLLAPIVGNVKYVVKVFRKGFKRGLGSR